MGSLRSLKEHSDSKSPESVLIFEPSDKIVVVKRVNSPAPSPLGSPVFEWAFKITLDAIPSVEMYVASVDSLLLSHEVVLVEDRGVEVAVAGKPQHCCLALNIREYTHFDILGHLLRWRQKVIGATHASDLSLSDPSKYKCKGSLSLLDGTGSVVGSPLTLSGCWPSSIKLPELSYAGTNIVTVRAVIEVDSLL